jgi:hypothetical protein
MSSKLKNPLRYVEVGFLLHINAQLNAYLQNYGLNYFLYLYAGRLYNCILCKIYNSLLNHYRRKLEILNILLSELIEKLSNEK